MPLQYLHASDLAGLAEQLNLPPASRISFRSTYPTNNFMVSGKQGCTTPEVQEQQPGKFYG